MKLVYIPDYRLASWLHEQKARTLAWALKNGDEILGQNPDGTQKRLISDQALQDTIQVVLAEPQHLKEIDRLQKAHAGAVAEARRWKDRATSSKRP